MNNIIQLHHNHYITVFSASILLFTTAAAILWLTRLLRDIYRVTSFYLVSWIGYQTFIYFFISIYYYSFIFIAFIYMFTYFVISYFLVFLLLLLLIILLPL